MRLYCRGFTLIELLVVVAILGIISAVGVVAYSGYKTTAEQKKAELSLNSIYLAEEEYRSNNGEYYKSTSVSDIVENLFDGKDNLTDQKNYVFSITGSGDSLEIKAKQKNGTCTLTMDEKSKITKNGR